MADNGTELTTKELFENDKKNDALDIGGISFFNWIAEAGLTLPPWWSQARDQEIRRFWKGSDHLAGAMNALTEIVTTIPFKIIPRDLTVKSHLKIAQEFQFNLENLSVSRGNLTQTGWSSMMSPFFEDYWSQDNGSYLFVEGDGVRIEGPHSEFIEGPLKLGGQRRLIQLDSARCWRTHNREWPIWYTDHDGSMFFLHHTRIINLTSMPSPITEMRGVGFCAVSRCPGIAQNLIDIITYKQEKLGSRPNRALMVIEGGGQRTATTISNQLKATDEANDNLGLRRYSKLPAVALKAGGSITLLDLNSIPDGFDELTATQLGITAIALAFGVDVRTLSFAIGVAGQTKADAEIQNMKTHSKGPATAISRLKSSLETMFLPPFLTIEFDFQDDTQDNFNAIIRKTRSERREKDLATGVTDIRVERQQMVKDGEITESQFIELELSNGRLEDGTPVGMLFFSTDREIQELLGDIIPQSSQEQIQAQIEIVALQLNSSLQKKAKQVLALLTMMQQADEDEEIEVEEVEPETELNEDVENEVVV